MVEGNEQEYKEDTVDDLDLESLITQGKDAILKREIEVLDYVNDTKVKKTIYVRVLTHDEKIEAEKVASEKNSKRDLELMFCTKAWLDKEGMPIPPSLIRQAPGGVVNEVYEVIKEVSLINDSFDRYIEKMEKS